MTLQFERKYSTQGSGVPCHVSFGRCLARRLQMLSAMAAGADVVCGHGSRSQPAEGVHLAAVMPIGGARRPRSTPVEEGARRLPKGHTSQLPYPPPAVLSAMVVGGDAVCGHALSYGPP
jgi:hypothetical protein